MILIATLTGIFDRGDNHIADAVVVLAAACVGDLDLATAVGGDVPVSAKGYDFGTVLSGRQRTKIVRFRHGKGYTELYCPHDPALPS